jgi:hypothetical protein
VLLTLKNSFEENSTRLVKIKNKSSFKGLKSLKIVKTHFWQKIKNKTFAQKLFLT